MAGSSGHFLQLEHGLERLDDDLGHQLGAKGPGQNITADVMLLRARKINLRGFFKRTLLKFYENRSEDGKPQWTHILVRVRDVEIDQVADFKGCRANDLVCPGLAVDTLDRWVNPQYLSNIALQNFRLVGSDEGLSDIRLVEEDVEGKGEG